MAEHTTGPWKIGDKYGPVMDEIVAPDGRIVAAVWTHRPKGSRGAATRREAGPVAEWIANANLIASAPRLAEQVRILREALTDNLQAWEGEEESVREEHAELIEETRDALEATKEGD